MTTTTPTTTETYREPEPELRHRSIPAGDARVAVLTRTYEASVEDVWDACTNPERVSRWYAPVSGEFRLGGTFQQVHMGSGTIVACDAPRFLKVALGGGTDEIELRIARGAQEGTTTIELQHATTSDSHTVGGEVYDAIYCMGGGYYPRLYALDMHLRGTLPDDYDSAAFHLNPQMRSTIERGSAAMAALIDADRQG